MFLLICYNMNYSIDFKTINKEIDKIMIKFPHTKKDLGYGYRRTFTNNKMWIDLVDYKQTWKNILRFGHGARLVKQYPVLYSLFDQVSKVISKIEIQDVDILYKKAIPKVLELIYQAPKNIGAI